MIPLLMVKSVPIFSRTHTFVFLSFHDTCNKSIGTQKSILHNKNYYNFLNKCITLMQYWPLISEVEWYLYYPLILIQIWRGKPCQIWRGKPCQILLGWHKCNTLHTSVCYETELSEYTLDLCCVQLPFIYTFKKNLPRFTTFYMNEPVMP